MYAVNNSSTLTSEMKIFERRVFVPSDDDFSIISLICNK